jgi:hypothetical protein
LEVLRSRLPHLKKPDEQNRITTERLEALLETLLLDAQDNGENAALIESVGNGNLRRALDAVASIFRPDQKLMDSLVASRARRGKASLPVDYVRRSILRGRSRRYDGDDPRCLVPNIYQGETALRTPQTLAIRILQHLEYRAFGGDSPPLAEVVSDFAMAGIDKDFLWRLLSRLRKQELVAVPHMNTEIVENDLGRLTPLGLSILRDWYRDEEYLDAAVFDTIVYEKRVFAQLVNIWRDTKLPTVSKFTLIRKSFGEYLEGEDQRLRDQINLDLLSPATKEPLGLCPSANDNPPPKRTGKGRRR